MNKKRYKAPMAKFHMLRSAGIICNSITDGQHMTPTPQNKTTFLSDDGGEYDVMVSPTTSSNASVQW